MLETVTGPGGSGTKAAVPNYRVAGKTGTARRAVAGGYEGRYVSVFAGVVPVSQPRLAAVVVVNDPRGGAYYGGLVAAPVFGAVMDDAMRLLNVTPTSPCACTTRCSRSCWPATYRRPRSSPKG